jgi:hypothetical protein
VEKAFSSCPDGLIPGIDPLSIFVTGSGGLGAMRQRKEAGTTSGGSAGRGAARLLAGLGRGRSCWRSCGSSVSGYRLYGSAGVRLFFDAHQILIRDFPPEMLVLAALFELLFEKDGAAGIGDKGAGSGQKDIAGAILHLNPAPEKGGIASHPVPSFRGRW